MICAVWVVFWTVNSLSTQIFKRVDSKNSNLAMKCISTGLAIMFVAHLMIGRLTNIWMVVFPVVFQAMASLCFDQLTSMYMSEKFPNRKEPYSIFKQIQNVVAGFVLMAYISMP